MTPKEERVWQHMLRNRKASVYSIAAACDVDVGFVENLIEKIGSPNWRETLGTVPAPPSASEILDNAAREMFDRAETYDKPAGERSMAAAVAAFEHVTGVYITETQGWQFMELLKMVRSNQGEFRLDNHVDAAAYASLAGEAAAKANNNKNGEAYAGVVQEKGPDTEVA